MEIAAFPPSRPDRYYEIVVAYHSDGQTYGAKPGDGGVNAHGQMWFTFMPPSN